ncbi:NUDIX hydrolase [Candidatus Curtissbacteria bacterium]|nr:NUDIX hydrolase [Candidatus Curtissbacteria bacterium]
MNQILNIVASPVIYKDKFLLIKRIKEPYFGLWCLPGGKMEYGETIEEAIIREIKEESSLDIKFIALRGAVEEILYKGKSKIGHFMIWVCETRAQENTAQTKNEGEVRWFTKKELPKIKVHAVPSDYRMIETFFLKKKKNLKIHKSKMRSDGKNYILEYFGV